MLEWIELPISRRLRLLGSERPLGLRSWQPGIGPELQLLWSLPVSLWTLPPILNLSLSGSKKVCFPWNSSEKLVQLKPEMEMPFSFRQDWALLLLASQAVKLGSRPLGRAFNNAGSRSWQICAPLTLLLGNKSTGLNFCSLKWSKESIQGRGHAVELRWLGRILDKGQSNPRAVRGNAVLM